MLLTRYFNYANAFFSMNEHSIPQLWHLIHENASSWSNLPEANIKIREQLRTDEELHSFLTDASSLAAKQWHTLCTAAGMTAYGAIALSWCDGGELPQVWEGWLTSGFPLKPLPEYERPARFLNPALLPQTSKLSELLVAVNAQNLEAPELYDLAVSATIVAMKEPLDFDLPVTAYASVRPQVAASLKSRMLQKPNRTAEEDALIVDWSAMIKGTEFDVWEGA